MDAVTSRLLGILHEYGRRLHVLLVKITLREDAAEELLQDLFLKLRDSTGFRGANQPERYLFQTAIHLAFDWRKRRSLITFSDSTIAATADETPSVSQTIEEREELERVLQAVDKLPSDDRDLIVMRYLQEVSYEELARLYETTPHRLRATCARIIGRLREQLAASGRISTGQISAGQISTENISPENIFNGE